MRSRTALLILGSSLLNACSPEDSQAGSVAPEAQGAANTDGVQVERILDPSTPVFLTVTEDGNDEALALLAAKDASGSPRAFTGVAFIQGDNYLTVEYDPTGRPVRLMTPGNLVRLRDYTESSVTFEHVGSDGVMNSEQIVFEPEELDELRVTMPSDEEVQTKSKALIGHSVSALAAGEHSTLEQVVTVASRAFGCFVNNSHAQSGPLWARIAFGALASLECDAFGESIAHIGDRYSEYISAAGSLAGCVGGIAASETPIGIGLALIDCPEAAEKIRHLVSNELYAIRANQGFSLEVTQGELVRGTRGTVTLRLLTASGDRSLADSSLGHIYVNLAAIGGPATEFTLRGGVLEWSGEVEPREDGQQWIPIRFSNGSDNVTLDLYVFPDRNVLQAQLHASSIVVTKGKSVDLAIEARGGTPPYHYVWTERRQYQSEHIMPDMADVDHVTVQVTERVQYSAGAFDSSSIGRNANAAPISIEVCGDGLCAPGEDAANCPDDCNDIKLCTDACAYRTDQLGCLDFPGVCRPLCIAILTAAASDNRCASTALDYWRCTYSRAALDLGCQTTDGGAVCRAKGQALDICAEE